ncbi:maleylpyruvate isomerase family mycothiol-dependent enzyme [Spongiactinospora sp. TRM90649]|uniref:maleylpyruvate isomerase family mycothiol-dependent enzyme n=1 Tax=Spongiactinospora sp. TRM90649 TaxID=3031114 RepID=UPI0023F69E6F|nr:maleylpyruvate isomerase family mycothiol-dependent enzyme [Spongiactinospora sp. TRM90649]MDF5757886.1 maleylpyruvate isomerase family mycothiol-dependent enzyme [Spongiactinospora sp. TRM90649]
MADPEGRLYIDALLEGGPPGGAVLESAVRPRLLTAARARRRPMAQAPAWAEPFAGRVAAMDALLGSVAPDDWDKEIVEGWNVQELVAHLAAKDGLLAAVVGAPVAGPPIVADDPLGRTAQLQEHERDRPRERTREDWRTQADALCAHLTGTAPDTMVEQGGMTAPAMDHLLARMLETWIHTEDAAGVVGVRLPRPLPGHIHPAADLCVRLLPLTMLLSGMDGSGRAARVTLTGDGGGEWDAPLGLGETASATDVHITCEVKDFCFLLAGRGDPTAFPSTIEGDQGLGRDILLSAPVLSGP